MRFIIGIGTGRTGTHSLAQLLNNQKNTICFHELNPACMKWEGAEITVNSMLREFEDLCTGRSKNVTVDYSSPNRDTPLKKIPQMESIDVVGDIGFYYLKYIPFLFSKNIDIKIPCIRRDKEETIQSYINKVRIPYSGLTDIAWHKLRKMITKEPVYKFRNHWIEHDGRIFLKDDKWDKCHPKFTAKNLHDALEKYWEYYYSTAEQFEKKYPENIRIFSMDDLNSAKGQINILKFCGFKDIHTGKFHTNKMQQP